MRRGSFLVLALTGALACTLSLWADEDREQAKHHHELRGKIVKVELENNEFTIKTYQGHLVVCVIDAQTVLKLDGRTIKLSDVRLGQRARCHCAALKNGKHYSQQLLLEKKSKQPRRNR